MARGNFRDYLQGETVWVKKYFYVLRPLLAILWIEQERGIVPMEFDMLVETLIDDPALRQAVDALLARKKSGEELDRGPRIPAISEFIAREMARLDEKLIEVHPQHADPEHLNVLFRETVRSTWAGQ
jgi:predicted nucleotidyltransferase